MISLLTERFCPCRRRCPLALITKEQRHKKNGEKRLIFVDFSVLFTYLFSIKLLSPSPTRDAGYLRPQTGYHHTADNTPSCHHIQNSDAKRTVSFCPDQIFYSDFYSPFYQLNWCRHPQLATWDIYAHRQDTTMPLMPLPRIAIYEAAMQKEPWFFVQNQLFTVISTHHFFN
jgi:hypothetical protein